VTDNSDTYVTITALTFALYKLKRWQKLKYEMLMRYLSEYDMIPKHVEHIIDCRPIYSLTLYKIK